MAAISKRVTHLAPASKRIDAAVKAARAAAAAVDRDARFPHEAFAALKAARLLGAMIPVEFGGEGISLGDAIELCSALGQACASTAMIFAMHQIKVSSLITHGRDSAWHADFMRRVVDEQLLLGSATTEAGIGGDMRNSICAIERNGATFHLVKEASVISYAHQCDAILVTARRNAQAASSDQVMAVVLRDQYRLEPTLGWDTMGMRGTCSEGFRMISDAPAEQIFPQPFAEIAAQSMLAMAHLMWAGAWFGIAADAVARAQKHVRLEARKKPGMTPSSALRLSETIARLQEMRSIVLAGVQRYENAAADGEALSSVAFAVAMNTVKISASELLASITQAAMLITGIAGYRNDSPVSVARHVRDGMSAAIMVHNDRIVANSANLLLVGQCDTSLHN